MKESPFYQEIMDEGRHEAQRAAVKEALEVRFGPEAAAEFAAALHDLTDSEQLSELHRLAVRCRRLAEFRKAISADL